MVNIEEKIEVLFERLKINKKLKGYKFLVMAVKLRYENPDYKRKIYTVIYHRVADEYNTTIYNVERDIRNVIESSWTKAYASEQRLWYDNVTSEKLYRPMASKFIEHTVKLLEHDKENSALNEITTVG